MFEIQEIQPSDKVQIFSSCFEEEATSRYVTDRESVGYDKSSIEEKYRFSGLEEDDHENPSDSQTGQLHSPVGCLRDDDIQVGRTCRHDEMSPAKRKYGLQEVEGQNMIERMPYNKERGNPNGIWHYQSSNLRNLGNNQECCSSLYQASTKGYSYNQIQDRKKMSTSSRTVEAFLGQTRQRKMGFCGGETALILKRQGEIISTPLPCLSWSLMGVKGLSRIEVCEEPNLRRGRRTGVCLETDETRKHRTFNRVLRKRF